MSLHTFCLVGALISFALGAANVPAGVNWLCLGLAFGMASLLT